MISSTPQEGTDVDKRVELLGKMQEVTLQAGSTWLSGIKHLDLGFPISVPSRGPLSVSLEGSFWVMWAFSVLGALRSGLG